MVFNATFNNSSVISWQLVLLVEETGGPGKNHLPVTSEVTDKLYHIMLYRTNSSYVKTMSCSGSHLGITINIKNTKFVKDLSLIDAQYRFNQCNSFREEYISVFSP
jgi:hypothetical protein